MVGQTWKVTVKPSHCEGNAEQTSTLLRAHVAKQAGTFNDFVASLPTDLVRESAA